MASKPTKQTKSRKEQILTMKEKVTNQKRSSIYAQTILNSSDLES
jgi:hypothetical protein